MSMTENNLSINLLGWVLSHHQTPAMETSRDTREQDPIDGLTYFMHGMSNELDFPTKFHLDYTWSWGNWSRHMMEMAPVWWQGGVTQKTPHFLCSASEENHGWNENPVKESLLETPNYGIRAMGWRFVFMAGVSFNPLIMGSWDFGQVCAPLLLQGEKVQKPQVRTGNHGRRWTNIFGLHFSFEYNRDYQNSWVIFYWLQRYLLAIRHRDQVQTVLGSHF